jgi:hypothetical protein
MPIVIGREKKIREVSITLCKEMKIGESKRKISLSNTESNVH